MIAGSMALASTGLQGQTGVALPQPSAGATQSLSFEVASVRLSPPDGGFTSLGDYPSLRFTAKNLSFPNLLGIAFGVRWDQLSGAPNWFRSAQYDIDAKAEGDTPLEREQMQPLLQQLLKDRFHLVVHREMKDFQGFALVVAKNGQKLQASNTKQSGGFILENELRFPSISMENFAGVLVNMVGRPVIDQTGIKGTFKIKVNYAPDNDPNSSFPSIFTALQETLGLKLVPQTVPVEMLVIDHVDRVPTEN
jgi:uncharacterized protein (TIGR03435 family)